MVLFIAVAGLSLLALATASPYPSRDISGSLRLRTDSSDSDDPRFPDSPASCGLCQQNYDSIKLCISVVPVMANSSTIISNPGSFINVISCACGDTFKSTFPQCVDCFEKTDQEALLNIASTDDVFTGINKVCALEGAIFGTGSTSSIVPVDGSSTTTPTPTSTPEATPTSTSTTTSATTSNGAVRNSRPLSGLLLGAVLLGSACW
ncbi:hypothetical protein DFH09DRAFT_1148327 [Mycena vulgaris]|nr:hypothetical protein DFH09DRAFT_1148327 [Mycena vulgaris]